MTRAAFYLRAALVVCVAFAAGWYTARTPAVVLHICGVPAGAISWSLDFLPPEAVPPQWHLVGVVELLPEGSSAGEELDMACDETVMPILEPEA